MVRCRCQKNVNPCSRTKISDFTQIFGVLAAITLPPPDRTTICRNVLSDNYLTGRILKACFHYERWREYSLLRLKREKK